MKKTIVIINGKYPYEKSEDFLSNEVNYINGYDSVICFPIFVFGNKSVDDIKYYRKPNCVITFTNSYSSHNKGIINQIPSILTSSVLYSELYCLIRSKRLSLLNIRKLLSFIIAANHAYKNIINKLEPHSNDNITIYSYWMHIGAYVAIKLKKSFAKKNKRIKTITRCHRFDLYEYADNDKYIPLRKCILDNINEIHSISQDGIDFLYDNYDFDRNKVFLSRLGTTNYGINISPKGEVLNIVSCSWMRAIKRVSYIARAIISIPIPINWTHYGDGEEFQFVSQLLKKNENPYITFNLKGSCNNDKILSDYKNNNYNLFINVSENEGVPVSIMEAMSFGKLIIATNVGGTSEIVENEVNGFLLNKDFSIDELSKAIIRVANLTSEEYFKMSKSSRHIWEKKCNAEKNYKEFYNSLSKSF